ncbi:2-keto-3-deoxy-galactonokinase (plasmid) [Paracoccus yeei]|uniref:2-keto-3-deoxy-galactonokinase n=1 Tax=Paracoccus yeei TaxID=147645 RepID=A0A386UTW2_9RHOB|nr:2-dehydro-3-deoxygalactonokinase [Paracoccus yeei]AYF04107.1 2-keto-3-deoxy-galactonokinase [Paracoccus yeei]
MARLDDPALIALDWGTTALRGWLLDRKGAVLAQARAARGLMQIADGDFAGAFDALTRDWPDLPAIASGMVGSASGWVETPYAACPAGPDDLARGLVQVPGCALWIVPGVRQPAPAPDVMRGEETEIVGALALRPDLAAGARILLPGTHSKWACVADGAIQGFTTFMTGELFAVLRDHSILGRGLSPATGGGAAFLAGVDAVREGGALAPLLFQTRARRLAGDLTDAEALDFLSGLLIGDELRSAGVEPGRPPLLVGDATLCARYARALGRFGAPDAVALHDAAVTGLWQLARRAGLVAFSKAETA